MSLKMPYKNIFPQLHNARIVINAAKTEVISNEISTMVKFQGSNIYNLNHYNIKDNGNNISQNAEEKLRFFAR
jgi:archaellum component FlaF (FlaF/FlaG flagellin family)